MLQTTAAITTAESACLVIFAYEAFFKDIQKCYLYSLSHSYHRCNTERENMETKERRKKKTIDLHCTRSSNDQLIPR